MALHRHRLASLLIGAIVLAACAPAQPVQTGSPAAPAAPQVPQVLNFGTSQLPASLDTRITVTGSARRNDIYETLTIQDTTGKNIEPLLATSWESVNPTTWDFKLVQSRKFHDGTFMTSDDVVYSFQQMMDPVNKFPTAARIGALNEIRAVDKYTIRLVTTAPDPIFLKKITQVAVYPKETLSRMGNDAFFLKPIGTGPFMVKEWVPQDHLTIVPFTEHPTRKAKLSEINVRLIPEASARVAGLRTGALDYVNAIPIELAGALKNDGFTIQVINAGYSEGYTIDTTQAGPLQNKLVRQAVNYAIDKEAIVKNIYKGFTQAEQGQLVQPETVGFNASLKPYPYDPAKAKALLAEAGYKDGFKATVDVFTANAERQSMALFIQSQLKEIGIDLDINAFNQQAVYSDKLYGRQPRAAMLAAAAGNAPAIDADYALDFFRASHTGGMKRYDNPEFDRVFLPSRTEMDPAKRVEILSRALAVFNEDPPYLFLVQQPNVWGWSPKVSGLVQRVPDDTLFDAISKKP